MFRRITLHTSNNKGMALVATLIMTLVISTIAIAMLSMTSNDIKLSSLQEASKETFNIAEAGIERAIAYLEDLGNPDYQTPVQLFMNDNDGSPIVGDGTYTVFIRSNTPLSYIVESTGEKHLNPSQKVKVKIESEVMLDNFAMFAYFSDNELFPTSIDSSYGSNQEIWFQGGDTIEGKLHSNDRLNMAGSPTFYGPVTSAYRNPATGDTSWKAYDRQTSPNFLGSPGYKGGVDRIELPTFRNITEPDDPKSLQRIAAGSKDFIDKHPATGVHIPITNDRVTDGILIKGEVQELVFGTHSASGSSEITIKQQNKTTIIYTIDNSITLKGKSYGEGTLIHDLSSDSYTHYPGDTSKINGVIFVNGEIKSLKATSNDGGVKGKYTIASNYDINITGDILYNTRVTNGEDSFRVDDGYPDIPDSLGLVTEKNIKIPKNTPSGSKVPNNIEINAIMMALGTSFYFEGFKTDLKDTLKVYGSFIQKQRGPVGTFSASSRTGYTKDYHFDNRMNINNPKFGEVLPPYFPTTGKYIKLWWREGELD